ncbi:MAG: CV_2116 domain-containing protein [Gemmatimonadales bacterium]
MTPVAYKGFAITARTFQVRGSGRWTLDLLIARLGSIRAFSGTTTYATEDAAITACCQLGRRIIDGAVEDCTVADLS